MKAHWMILVSGLIVRLVLAPFTQDMWDLKIWALVGDAIANGVNPYAVKFNCLPYPYPPLWGWICAFMVKIWHIFFPTGGGDWLLRLLLKLPIILADCALAITVCCLDEEKSNRKTLFYMLNPVTICISSMWGMFDALPTLFLLWSLVLLAKDRLFISAITFGFSCCFKFVYPAFVIPWLLWYIFRRWDWKKAAIFALQSFSLVLAISCYYLFTTPREMLHAMFSFHSERGAQVVNLWTWLDWSLNCDPQSVVFAANIALPLGLIAVFLILVWRFWDFHERPREFLFTGVAAIITAFFVFSKVVNEQYSVWLLALLLVLPAKKNYPLRFYLLTSLTVFLAIACHLGMSFFRPVLNRQLCLCLPEFIRYKATGWAGLGFWLSNLGLLAFLLFSPKKCDKK